MARGGTNSSLRKYLGSIKDTTTISLAKVNSDYKVFIYAYFSELSCGQLVPLIYCSCSRSQSFGRRL